MKIFTIIILFAPILGFSQKLQRYKIKVVTSDFYNDKTITIAPAIFTAGNEYNENKIGIISLVSSKNQFELSGSFDYPAPVSFSYTRQVGSKNQVVTSDFLFLDKGSSNIYLNDLTKDKEIGGEVALKANYEYRTLKKLYRNLEIDNGGQLVLEKENIVKKDEILKSYVKSHPNSYVAMWVLIHDYQLYGYSYLKEGITRLFSNQIIKTQSFKALLQKITTDKTLLVNNRFPYYHYSFGQDLESTVKKSRYTLVEFWASFCTPCIAQFPDLKRIYSFYKQTGFSVYSISTDQERDIHKMNAILSSEELKWDNEMDVNGSRSAKLNIIAIPRNFLLNSKGEIVAADISMRNLEIFLKENG